MESFFPDCLKLSRQSGNFPDCLETFKTDLKLSKLAQIFPDCQESFQTGWKLSTLSRNFPDSLETFRAVWKLSRQSEPKSQLIFFQFLLRLNYVFCWKPKLPIWLEKGNNFGRCWPFSILANWHVTNCYNLCNLWIWLDSCTDRLHPNRRLKGITFYLSFSIYFYFSSSIFIWILKNGIF